MKSPFEYLKAALEAGRNVIELAKLAPSVSALDHETRDAFESEVIDLQRVVKSVGEKLETMDSESQMLTVGEFILGTSQSIVSRIVSGQSGQISVRLGVDESE